MKVGKYWDIKFNTKKFLYTIFALGNTQIMRELIFSPKTSGIDITFQKAIYKRHSTVVLSQNTYNFHSLEKMIRFIVVRFQFILKEIFSRRRETKEFCFISRDGKGFEEK